MEKSIIPAVRVLIRFGDELDDILTAGTPNRDPRSSDSPLSTIRGRRNPTNGSLCK
ncbi:hypothetical protein F2Q70_00042483 [Brassica cretica]|uniref:Uncharacterized protein n=2 Tax=Brassica cretica TaxID=69181 RepID=A0A8S9KJ21_BRACR|nr:hypothetical protein F2Q70_00042483 [Brassica cretica]KAF3520369.1 hypothetical protein DY000_02058772 [Brassica cretica]